MARPQPVIVPALKMDLQESQIDLGLGRLLPLLDRFIFEPKKKKAIGESLGLTPEQIKGFSLEQLQGIVGEQIQADFTKNRLMETIKGSFPTQPISPATGTPLAGRVPDAAEQAIGIEERTTAPKGIIGALTGISQLDPKTGAEALSMMLGLGKPIKADLSQGIKDILQGDPTVNINDPRTITPTKIEEARKQVQSDKVAVSAATGAAGVTAKFQAELELPYKPSALKGIVDKTTGLPATPGLTPKQFISNPDRYEVAVPAREKARLEQRPLVDLFNDMEKLVKAELSGVKSPLDRGLKAPSFIWNVATQSNADLVLLHRITKATTSMIIRRLGEKGTLTDKDREVAQNLQVNVLPIPDTMEVATKKIAAMRKYAIDRGLLITGKGKFEIIKVE